MRATILIALILSSTTLCAQSMELSLAEAQAKAIEMNRNVQISALEIDKAKKIVKETMAIGLPQINAEGTFQHFLDIPTQVLPDFISPSVYGVLISEGLIPSDRAPQPGFVPAQFGTDYNLTGGISLNQLLFNGSYLIGLKAAKSYVEMSELQKLKTDLDVKTSVTEAYHTVLIAQDNAEILSESILTLEQLLKEVSAMYAEGFVEEQDAQQLQITLNSLQSQKQNAERQIDLTKQLLNMSIGLPLETDITLSDDIPRLISDPKAEELLVKEPTIAAHPDMLIMEQGILLQNLKIKEQRSRYLPTLNGFFSHQQQAQRNEFDFFDSDGDWFPSTVWGVSLQVPIFSSGMKANQVKQLQIGLKEAEIQRDMVSDGLQLERNKSRSDYIYARDAYRIEEENLALAEDIRNKTRIKYKEGISSSFELNQMETQYLEGQAKLIKATMDLLNTTIQLKKVHNAL